MLSSSEVKHVALSIEEQLFRYFGDSGPQYKHRNRYILYHIKDKMNKVGPSGNVSTHCLSDVWMTVWFSIWNFYSF